MRGASDMRRNPHMNFKAARWAAGVSGLGAHGRSILLSLAHMADLYGVCFPSWNTLAIQSQCSERTVGRNLQEFERRNLVIRQARFAKHHGRISSFYILIGWPERALIPATGHPSHGIEIRETRHTRSLHEDLQPERHRDGVPVAMQNQSLSIKDSTTAAEITIALERCLQALGPWANDQNRNSLTNDMRGLSALCDEYDLETHILPVLAEKSSHGTKAPPLKVWKYFREPIRNLAMKLERKRSPNVSSPPGGGQL